MRKSEVASKRRHYIFPLHYSFLIWILTALDLLLSYSLFTATESYTILSILRILSMAASLAVYSFITPSIRIVHIFKAYAVSSALLALIIMILGVSIALARGVVLLVLILALLGSTIAAALLLIFEALLPLIFAGSSLLKANSAINAVRSSSFLAMTMMGLAIDRLGLESSAIAIAVLAIVSTFPLLPLAKTPAVTSESNISINPGTVFDRDLLRLVFSDCKLRKLIIWGSTIASLAGGPLSLIIPVAVAKNILGFSATNLSIMFALFYGPVMLGSLTAMKMKIREPVKVLGSNLAAISALLTAFTLLYTTGNSSTLTVMSIAAIFALTSVLTGMYNVIISYTYQTVTPRDMIPKLFSLRFLLTAIPTSIGSYLGAYIVETYGVPTLTTVLIIMLAAASANLLMK